MHTMTKEIESAIIAAVKEAGKIISAAHEVTSNEISDKEGSVNFVTVYDVRVQKMLIGALWEILPEAKFLAEEQDNDLEALQKGFVFVIDPIDGTTNFIRDLGISAVSVGLYYDGEAEFGVIYDPYRDELFRARRDGGAYCNDRPIHVSEFVPEKAIWSVGTAPYSKKKLGEKTVASISYLYMHGGDVRRMGAATLDLAYVAAGRLDGFFEWCLCPWDFGAGRLLIEEAGGIVETIGEEDTRPRFDRASGTIAGSAASMEVLRAAADAAKTV